MRILHTSDWHLGRSFLGVGMLEYQAAFVDHLLDVVEQHEVDLVVVPGDVYDRALPPGDAVLLLERTLDRLAASRATTVVTSGNHDSQLRLGFAARLIDHAGVHLRTRTDDVGTPVVLSDEHGPVAVHALPYLDPEHLHGAWRLSARSHEATMREALRRVRADLAARPSGTRSVLLAHAFVARVGADVEPCAADTGVETSDSERDLSVGGVQVVPLSLFDGIDYVALGHLHGRHTLSDRVRYCGSPLAYSFSEASHTKGSWLVDLDAAGFAGAQFVAAPVPRRLARLRGRLDDLLDDAAHAWAETCWVQAVLTDPVRPRLAMPRLERRFPHALSVNFDPDGAAPARVPVARSGPGVSDAEIALDFVRDVRGRAADPAETALLVEAVEAAAHDRDDLRDRRAVG